VQIIDLNKRVDSLNTVLSTTRDNAAKEANTLNATNKKITDELTDLQTSYAKATEEIEKLKTDLGELTQQNLELEAKMKAIEVNPYQEILGSYYSLKQHTIEYAGGKSPHGPFVTMKIIKNSVGTLIAEFNYTGDIPYGCSGHETVAKAEILSVEKLDCNSFKLILTKSSCGYSYAQGCEPEDGFKEYKENKPKINSEFSLIIDLQNNNNIRIESSSSNTQCLYAWKFSNFSFKREK
jgi:hypothetical protein